MSNCLYVVMPSYNEEANIENVVNDWYKVLDFADESSRLIIADGGSKDHTIDILNKLKGKFPKLEVFSQPGTDHGTKVIWLYKYAIKNNADYIFQTDSDGQTRAEEFESFWEMRKQYEAVIGNRVIRGDGFLGKLLKLSSAFLFIFFLE